MHGGARECIYSLRRSCLLIKTLSLSHSLAHSLMWMCMLSRSIVTVIVTKVVVIVVLVVLVVSAGADVGLGNRGHSG